MYIQGLRMRVGVGCDTVKKRVGCNLFHVLHNDLDLDPPADDCSVLSTRYYGPNNAQFEVACKSLARR